MEYGISHSFEEETLEAKAKWFQQKPMEERLREALEDMVTTQQLMQFEPPDDRPTFKTVRILKRK